MLGSIIPYHRSKTLRSSFMSLGLSLLPAGTTHGEASDVIVLAPLTKPQLAVRGLQEGANEISQLTN